VHTLGTTGAHTGPLTQTFHGVMPGALGARPVDISTKKGRQSAAASGGGMQDRTTGGRSPRRARNLGSSPGEANGNVMKSTAPMFQAVEAELGTTRRVVAASEMPS